MSQKKYLSLEEAAAQLGVSTDDLMRLREKGDIRGFADRGTWKFKYEDVEEMSRQRQGNSDPDLPFLTDDAPAGDSAIDLGGDDVGDQPTIIRGYGSDSDVKLVPDEPKPFGGLSLDSDSDIKMADNGAKKGPGSASDIRFAPDSDSDVKLAGDPGATEMMAQLKGSDSEIRLAPVDESDVRFVTRETPSDSDVALLRPGDSSVALDFTPDDSSSASVLSDDNEISLSGDSAMMLASESGISLEGPADSGISLESGSEEGITLADDSGIALGAGDSGISLDLAAGDSGISLDKEFGGTMPMMDVAKLKGDDADTSFEIPSMKDDSAYEMKAVNDKTATIDMSGDDSADDAVFNIDDDEEATANADDELEVVDDAFGEDDDLGEDLDVLDADEEVFAADEADSEFAAPSAGGRYVPVEQEWGTGVMVGVCLSSVLLLLVGAVMFDLVKTMWMPGEANAVAGPVLNALGGLYK
jgi:excisionase family DNA binding protein